MQRGARPQLAVRRLLSWALVAAAVSFVAWVLPFRDHCREGASSGPRVGVTWVSGGCVLHGRAGDTTLDRQACASLDCEPGMLSTLARTRTGVVLAMLAVYGLGSVAAAGRWRTLLGLARVDLSLVEVWRVFAQAQAGGILLPGGLGGDALRVATVIGRPTRDGSGRASPSIVIASVLLDRAVGLALIAGVAALMGWASRAPAEGASGGLRPGPLVAFLTLIPIGFVAGLALLRRAPEGWLRWGLRGRLAGVLGPVLAYVRDPGAPRAVALAAAWSVVVAVAQFAVIRGLVVALAAQPTQESWIYVGTTMAFLVAALPLLPGAWGTADATYVYFFKFAGLPAAVSLAVCLLFRFFWYLLGVVGAFLQLAAPVTFDAEAASRAASSIERRS